MPRTSNPLANLFQAMGQCSTTPAEQQQQQSHAQYAQNNGHGTAETSSHGSRSDRSRHASKASSRSYHTAHTSSQQYQAQQARDDNSDAHMSDANAAAGASDNARRRSSSSNGAGGHNVAAMVANARHANKQFDPYMAQQQQQEQQRRSRSRSTSRRRASPSPHRQGPSSAPSTLSGTREPTILTAPPAGAEKKRCYRLNLEVPGGIPSVDPATGQHIFGPLIYEPPAHHLPGGFRKSSSWHSATAGMRGLHVSTGADNAMLEDDDDDKEEGPANEVEIAVKTASIFRGIKVDARTGEILEQNARASRSQKKNGGGNGKKAGEKSRQVAKIDKAQDLVDEDGDGGIVS